MDSYRRGKQVDRNNVRARVRAPYRGVLPLIWAIGAVLLLVVSLFVGPDGALAVVFVMHLFFAGIIHLDIKVQRRQGLEWGLWRHLWFGAAVVFPLVALVYDLYSGRKVRAENERRNTGTADTDESEGDGDSSGDTDETETTDATDVETRTGQADNTTE